MSHLSFHSPVGELTLFEEDGTIVSLDWGGVPDGKETPVLVRARDQLDAYFDGSLQAFDLPMKPLGTTFQRKVWEALCRIPYGEIRRYGELAAEIGSAPRAIGGACGRNPIPILIPCHRVVAGNGGLGGYSGWDGIETKRFLLGLEGVAGYKQEE
ncbi:MAG: methylated-DNA--[protein]-cysteine S-methyltransferase [Rhodospirillales bacterium]|nr:methylated-DNA--[protein]-cysteine S-methyltransferase [Rhodospirillales bacterium]